MPFYGSRKLAKELCRQGHHANRKRVQRLMRIMNLSAIYPKPNLSKRYPDHIIYPYLLRGVAITRPNQVWGGLYHLYSATAGLALSGSHYGLGQLLCSGLGGFNLAGWRVLYSLPSEGPPAWKTGYLQYRSGCPVHGCKVYQHLEGTGHQDQYGWPRPGSG